MLFMLCPNQVQSWNTSRSNRAAVHLLHLFCFWDQKLEVYLQGQLLLEIFATIPPHLYETIPF